MGQKFINYSGTFTDLYELSMGEVYFKRGKKNEMAVFDYFFRKLPYASGYAIFCGIESLLSILEELSFSQDDLNYLRELQFDKEYLEYLSRFRFSADIYSCAEGDIVFPNEPILRVEGPLIEVQIIETLLLNTLNFQTLIATKAARMRSLVPEATLLEFGLRRAQGPAGYFASKAALVGGFDGTSHVLMARDFHMEASGTMAHSFIQSEDDELTAFRKFAQERSKDCILLIDTYSTLDSGLPHAIIVAKEMEKRGLRLKGIRLDSGDLAYLSHQCRKKLDAEGLNYVKIVVSNQLDEYVIASLVSQGAPIDAYGVGTKLVTGFPDAALDGVYKLCELGGKPRIKISESISKISLPYKKEIYRMLNDDGTYAGIDAVALTTENSPEAIFHPTDPFGSLDVKKFKKRKLLKKVLDGGKRVSPVPRLNEIRQYCLHEMGLLPLEYKRHDNPHSYKVGLTGELKNKRDDLVKLHKENTYQSSNHR